MNMLVFFMISCVLTCTLVQAGDECQDQISEFKKAWHEVVKEGNAPECFQKYELQKFNCSGDEEEDRKKYVLDESRSFFRVHTGYFSNIPKCIKAEFIASWACSQSSVVSSSQR
ncbi:hypothetical protein TNCV_4735811 [Trichonephila clavipes]|nr:hypothetical protein TNCV_4735811 [Trichonephila clavipes]